MRRILLLSFVLALAGCTGFGTFIDHTFTVPGVNPNLPQADSENVRRARGLPPEIGFLQPEPGNVWPTQQGPDPTLAELQRNQRRDGQRGSPSASVPGAEPGLLAGRQPRPLGSSTPPGSPAFGSGEPGFAPLPAPTVQPRARLTRPTTPPNGGVVQTPQGPAVDTGGTSSYRQLNGPAGPGSIMVPNGNGTSTVINPNGTVQTIPTPR